MILSQADRDGYMSHLADLEASGVIKENAIIFYIQQFFIDDSYVGSSIYLRSGSEITSLWVEDDEDWTTTLFDSLFSLYRNIKKKGNKFTCWQYTPFRGKYECSNPFTLDLSEY